jgi:predicted metal-dependent phosphoesterase TrpH
MTPDRVVRIARHIGLAAVGIADHDTDAGIAEALRTGDCLGIEVIPALEINTDVDNREIHVLGYMVWPVPARLSGILEKMREVRRGRLDEMVRRLNALGVNITAARVREIAGGSVIGRPHVARAMVEAGCVRSIEEAFEIYLDIGRPCYVERYKISPEDAVRELAMAGGIPVLAHPASAGRDDLIPGLVKAGLMGIEVYHPDHDRGDEQRYLRIAEREGLLVTGGSDSHGEDERGPTIGRITVPYATVLEMKEIKARMEYPGGLPDKIDSGATKPRGGSGGAAETHD